MFFWFIDVGAHAKALVILKIRLPVQSLSMQSTVKTERLR